MVWGCACGLDIIVRLFLSLFELSHFFTSMNKEWVPCERNSSYNFILIFLKLCTGFLYGLKMCIWFGYNPCINFCHFFHFANFVISWPQILWKCIDSGYLVSATPHTILYWSFWNFAHVFAMVWRCACGLDNRWINFCHFFHFVNFVIFWPQILWKCIDSGHHVSATPYTPHAYLHSTLHIFLKMCIWFGFNPAVNFCHFSFLLTLSFFAGATSTSPKFDLYFLFKKFTLFTQQYK